MGRARGTRAKRGPGSPVKLWVTLEGREAEVKFHTQGDRLIVESDGRHIEADFVRLSPAAEGLEVELRGTVIPVEVKHPLEKMLQASSSGRAATRGETVTAPMPGVVVALRVKAGDPVKAGQAVIVVEAMKMQNELAVAHDGVVREVLVGERAAVSAGQPLLRVSPA